jgi:hypothetical protein
MVQFRAIDRRRAPAELMRSFETRAAALKQRVYEKMAEDIVARSPVDTGTYIMAHTAGAGRDSGFTGTMSSLGKVRGRSHSEFASAARAQLLASVAAIPANATDVYFRNAAMHAPQVEYLGWSNSGSALNGMKEPKRVYARARAKAPQLIRDAAAELGFDLR